MKRSMLLRAVLVFAIFLTLGTDFKVSAQTTTATSTGTSTQASGTQATSTQATSTSNASTTTTTSSTGTTATTTSPGKLITAPIGLGSRGDNVTMLQTLLALSPMIYPEGLITGYYGPATAVAVTNFQTYYGLSPVGRVGPMTLARINSLISSGYGIDIAAPQIYTATSGPQESQSTAVFAWSTGEPAYSRVYYNTTPLKFNEGDIRSAGFAVLNGQVASATPSLATSQTVVVTGLTSNTLYYSMITSTDSSGNVNIYGPNNTFRTSP